MIKITAFNRFLAKITGKRKKEIELANTLKQDKLNRYLTALSQSGSFFVLNGPFKGMQYINESNGSALLPKIVGSYEEPIQEWVAEIINCRRYNKILDVGCAEGYYAVGFALHKPNCEVIGFDTNQTAIKNAIQLSKINKVENITFKNECTHSILNNIVTDETLIFCDIEGAELDLFDPAKVFSLRNADMLIETHDCFIPNLTDTLVKRFLDTHVIRLCYDYPFRVNKYQVPPDKELSDDPAMLYDEIRSKGMNWIYLKAASNAINP